MNRVTEDLDISPPDFSRLQDRFNKAVRNSRLALLAERIWPRVVSTACTTGFLASASWAGLWHALPPGGRMAGVAFSAAALLASPFFPKTGSLRIQRSDALRRLDRDMGATVFPGPATMIEDVPAGAPADDAYWRSRTEILLEQWKEKLQASRPKPDMARYDPHRLRYAVAAMTVVAAIHSGPAMQSDIRKAFDWAAPVVPIPPPEVKAWVRPPSGADALSDRVLKDEDAGRSMNAYEGSTLIVQVYGTQADIRANNQPESPEKEIAPRPGTNGKTTYQYEIPLKGEKMTVSVANGPEWSFTVDKLPSPDVTLHSVKPKENNANRLELEYSIRSDRAVPRGEAILDPSKKPDQDAEPLPSAHLPKIQLQPQ